MNFRIIAVRFSPLLAAAGILAVIMLTARFVHSNYNGSADIVEEPVFNGERAYLDVVRQVDLGPRTSGSQAHTQFVNWLQTELASANWHVDVQETEQSGQSIRNVIARRDGINPWIILGAHYDSRFFADRDPDPRNRTKPVPGANDGASGVAVLVELARVLPKDLENKIWLVFFDAEDNGGIQDWDWILGSTAFVRELEGKPEAVIIIDMVGDADLNIYQERKSDLELTQSIWSQAEELGYSGYFIPMLKYRMLDDHIPFIDAGIPAVLIIDFDYEYWHTVEDTADKVSARSLQIVGETLLAWLMSEQ
jgi:glutaminyl-peptide cyclotransferase